MFAASYAQLGGGFWVPPPGWPDSAVAWLWAQPPNHGPFIDRIVVLADDVVVLIEVSNLPSDTDHRIADDLAAAVIRQATVRASMPERRRAHAVRARPPAPAAANRRVAATPAMVIW